jgi:hypothetical protein
MKIGVACGSSYLRKDVRHVRFKPSGLCRWASGVFHRKVAVAGVIRLRMPTTVSPNFTLAGSRFEHKIKENLKSRKLHTEIDLRSLNPKGFEQETKIR